MDPSSGLPEHAAESPAPFPEAQAKGHGKMTLGEIFSQALEIYRNNLIMIVPSLLPIAGAILGLAFFAGFIGFAAVFGRDGFLAFSAVGGILLFIILLIVLFIVAEGVTIEMIREASAGSKADLELAWEASRPRMEPLILSSFLAGIIIALGYLLFVLPGMILSFVFYFVAQAVMIDGRSGIEALKTSYRFVEANLSDSLIIILASLAIGFILPMIPFIGFVLSFLSLPYIYALATLLYLDRRETPSPRPQTKVDIS